MIYLQHPGIVLVRSDWREVVGRSSCRERPRAKSSKNLRSATGYNLVAIPQTHLRSERARSPQQKESCTVTNQRTVDAK
ncbi:MAG TPA: hypothetical protein VLM76_09685 [Patescibacteria group bacterium]|jgi:hypothetical protein|nr:hypothetical protein [Patescibacteria group bacterium]